MIPWGHRIVQYGTVLEYSTASYRGGALSCVCAVASMSYKQEDIYSSS